MRSSRGLDDTIGVMSEVTNFFMDNSPKNKNFLDDLFKVSKPFFYSNNELRSHLERVFYWTCPQLNETASYFCLPALVGIL